MGQLSYINLCKKLNLTSLEFKRLHSDLLLCYKNPTWLHCGATCPIRLVLRSSSLTTRGYALTLYISHCRILSRQTISGNRISKSSNSLPSHVALASNIKQFKGGGLKKCKLSKFTKQFSH